MAIALDETATAADVDELLEVFAGGESGFAGDRAAPSAGDPSLPAPHARTIGFLTHPVFNSLPHRARDAALHQAARGARPVAHHLDDPARLVHDEAQRHLRDGAGHLAGVRRPPPLRCRRADGGATRELFRTLERWLCEITGFTGCSLQPNAGSQGEYAGLLVIRAYHHERGRARTATSA